MHVKTRVLVGIAEPVGTVAFDNPVGARQSKDMDKRRRAEIRKLGRTAPNIDTVQESLRIAAMIPRLRSPRRSHPCRVYRSLGSRSRAGGQS